MRYRYILSTTRSRSAIFLLLQDSVLKNVFHTFPKIRTNIQFWAYLAGPTIQSGRAVHLPNL